MNIDKGVTDVSSYVFKDSLSLFQNHAVHHNSMTQDGYLTMVSPIIFLLFTLAVSCSAFFCGRPCDEALTDFCSGSDDSNTICQGCSDSGGLCALTNDPLICHDLLKAGAECAFGNETCDANTHLSYGCYLNYCYSQCVGEDYGEQEWCYLSKRQPGPRVDHTCSQDSDCEPSLLNTVQCSSHCDTTFKK